MATRFEARDFFPYSWQIIDGEKNVNDKILVWALDQDSKPNLLIIDNYRPYFYIEINRRMLGTNMNNASLWNLLPEVIGTWLMNRAKCSVKPAQIKKVRMYKLHYYSKNKTTFLKVSFTNVEEANRMAQFLQRGHVVDLGSLKLGFVNFKVHESNFSDFNLINRLMAEPYCKFKYSGWCKFKVAPIDERKRISEIPEWRVNCYDVLPESEIKVTPNPVVLSYDIETYTPDHKKYWPKSSIIQCPCYLLTIYVGRLGTPISEHKKQIIVLAEGTINDDFVERGVEVVNLRDESRMIQAFTDAIDKYDPDILTGFNIGNYDNPYLDNRRRLFRRLWQNCSRLKSWSVDMKNHDHTGERENKILLCPGRITVDVLAFVLKNKKLKNNSLSQVAKVFLKEDKRDVPYEEQFLAYRAWLNATKQLKRIKQDIRHIAQSHYRELVDLIKDEEIDYIHGISKLNQIARDLLSTHYEMNRSQLKIISEYLVALHLIYRVMDYGDQDAYLPYRLFEKLNIFPNIAAMAAVNYINPEEVYIRGESIRCHRMIYQMAKYIPSHEEREAMLAQGRRDQRPYVIDSRVPVKYHIAGGYVKDPIPGVHDVVATVDFKSLYPNEMITNNLCYTTLLPEGVPPKDVKYNNITVPVPEHNIEYSHNWVDPSVRIGVIPLLEITLINERNRIRGMQKQYEEGSLEWILLEAQQLAVKIACNAAYGFLGIGCNLDKDKSKSGKNKNVDDFGAKEYFSKLPLPEASMCITYCGRTHVQQIMETLREWYPDVVVVYGDTDSAMFHIPSIKENYFQSYVEVGKRLSATMPGTLELEMENVSKILLFKKKHYIKWYYARDQDRLNIDIHGPNHHDVGSERGIPKARRDRPNTIVDVHTTLSNFILKGEDPIVMYRWMIEYVMDLYNKDLSYFEIVKGYNAQADGSNKTIVKRMEKLGVIINHRDRFGYVVCKDDNETKVGETAYEIQYFLQSQNSDKPLEINYHYYLKGLVALDEMTNIMPKLPERFNSIEYQRNNRCNVINFCKNPFKLMTEMTLGGHDIADLLDLFEDIASEEA